MRGERERETWRRGQREGGMVGWKDGWRERECVCVHAEEQERVSKRVHTENRANVTFKSWKSRPIHTWRGVN